MNMDLVRKGTWDPPRSAIYSEVLCVWRGTEILFLRSGTSEDAVRHYMGCQSVRSQEGGFAVSQIDTDIFKFEYGDMGCCLYTASGYQAVRVHAVMLLIQSHRCFEKSILPRCGLLVDGASHQISQMQILQMFEDDLLFDAFQKVNWEASGRTMFLKKLEYFIENELSIEMALPAFPCKTSNSEKAASRLPDAAEYLALKHLYAFCVQVGRIYRPGCYINIISDGHVFSDCIGVDDHVVDAYNSHLQTMLESVKKEMRTRAKGGIRFYRLGDLLKGAHLDENSSGTCESSAHLLLASVSDLQNVVNHPVRTQLDPTSEIDRALLLLIGSPPAVFLQEIIKTHPEHPLTKLFRGFSRFMFEDLAFHPDYMYSVSAKQRHKVAEKVAVEMILRNQSYSRLVEMVMPGHIRLSIHAHNNAGPKFAIRTLPKYVKHATSVDDLVKAVLSAGTRTTQEDDSARETLHIPTPWHNTLVRAGSETFICKAKLARGAANMKGVVGKYEQNHEHGCYILSLDDSK